MLFLWLQFREAIEMVKAAFAPVVRQAQVSVEIGYMDRLHG